MLDALRTVSDPQKHSIFNNNMSHPDLRFLMLPLVIFKYELYREKNEKYHFSIGSKTTHSSHHTQSSSPFDSATSEM